MKKQISLLNSIQRTNILSVGTGRMPQARYRHILGMRVDATSYEEATHQITQWAKRSESRYICAANVHMTMESFDNPQFLEVVNRAALVTPDGMPLALALRALGIPQATRVCGPTLTLQVCEMAAREKLPIALYGSKPETLDAFANFLTVTYPGIQVVCQISPPFRALTAEEDEAFTRRIVASRARILLVGIGCPKQEFWMASHQGRIPAVMLGIGAAFDFHAGTVKRAPLWMQQLCLEWLYRLMQEPKRLWKRYTWHNLRFLMFFLQQWFKRWVVRSS